MTKNEAYHTVIKVGKANEIVKKAFEQIKAVAEQGYFQTSIIVDEKLFYETKNTIEAFGYSCWLDFDGGNVKEKPNELSLKIDWNKM